MIAEIAMAVIILFVAALVLIIAFVVCMCLMDYYEERNKGSLGFAAFFMILEIFMVKGLLQVLGMPA